MQIEFGVKKMGDLNLWPYHPALIPSVYKQPGFQDLTIFLQSRSLTLLKSLTAFLGVFFLLQPGYSLSQNMAYFIRVASPSCLGCCAFYAWTYLLEDTQHILDNVANTAAHWMFLLELRQGVCFRVDLAIHYLLAEFLLNSSNYTHSSVYLVISDSVRALMMPLPLINSDVLIRHFR